MTTMDTKIRQSNSAPQLCKDEQGFILVLSLMALVMVSLLGAWALTTSTFEIKIAGNEQIKEASFNISEGGVYLEGSKLGFTTSTNFNWYNVSDPSTLNQLLLPPLGTAGYDPGDDIPAAVEANITIANIEGTPNDATMWPRQNLTADLSTNATVDAHVADDSSDYAYLVRYLYPDIPPKGYDAGSFAAYKFRLNAEQTITVEIGGLKVGVKAAI